MLIDFDIMDRDKPVYAYGGTQFRIGSKGRVYEVNHEFAKGIPGPQLASFGTCDTTFVVGPDIGRWLDAQGTLIALVCDNSEGWGNYRLYFENKDTALLYKLTWGGAIR